MPLYIEENNSRDNNKHRRWSENFGSFIKLSGQFKSNESILYQIFLARSGRTLGGCLKCKTNYAQFKKVMGQQAYRCKCGKKKVFPLKGTHLQNSKVKLKTVVELLYDMINNKNGLPARNRQRFYGFSEETSHKILMKLSDWMGHCLDKLQFTPQSTIEIDEVYPKFVTGLGPYIKLKRGEGSQRTHGVLVMCERDGITRAFPYDKSDSGAIKRLIAKWTKAEDNHTFHTDEKTAYDFMKPPYYNRKKVKHNEKNFATGEVHINTAEGFNSYIKINLHSVHKGVHPEYLALYCQRYAFIHTVRGKSFPEVFEMLLASLPPLNEKVKANVKNRKRSKDQDNNNLLDAA